MELEIIGGPDPLEATAYRWRMPKPRHLRLKDYRVGYVLDDPFCRVTPEVLDVLTNAVTELRKAGLRLEEGWPPGVDPLDSWDTYYRLTAAAFSPVETEATLGPMRGITTGPWAHSASLWLDGNAMSHKDWITESTNRLNTRRIWQDYFKTYDAFLTPECFVPAFPHDHSKTFDERMLSTSLGERPYGDILKWIAIATLTGCPATSAPVGRTDQGLAVGIHIIGPYLEDATPIDIAAKMRAVVGGFQPPPL
jgi:amidase